MEKLDFIWRVVEILVAAVGASILTRILTIKQRVKQEEAETSKKEEEVKKDQIDNIRKTMEEVYRPIIEDLQKAVADARSDAERACQRVNELEDKVDALEREKRELRRENDMFREVLQELCPDLVPSKRSVAASRSASNRTRNANGTFAKEE